MADNKSQMINPPHTLKDKVGTGGPGAVDPSTLQRAEQVIAGLAENYLEWVEEDLVRLHKAVAALSAATEGGKAELEAIYQVAHDMKGQGGSFGYQLITVVGNQLCRFIEPLKQAGPNEAAVIKLHADTMSLIIANRIKGDGGEAGEAVLAGLNKVAAKIGG
jgi:hypothetical protein